MENKTFKDLDFKPHQLKHICENATQAKIQFKNGYSLSVIFGEIFYSNGIDTYEVGCFCGGEMQYIDGVIDGIQGHLNEKKVTDLMLKIQNL
ncbi:MAG: hypothetical protein RLZZ414_557 [Bacteroidota bacterium]|jgi:hypothetical protein